MKKITLLVAVVATMFAGNVNAQEEKNTPVLKTGIQLSGDSYKPGSGDSSLELSFDPGAIFATGGDQFSLDNAMIKYRKFTSETSAFRLSANFSFGANVTITQQEDTKNNLEELKDKDSYFSLSLRPGIEKHFSGTKKLSPYFGAEGIIGYASASMKSEYQDANQDIEYVKTKGGAFTLGAGVFAGVDYYFVKNLYLGVEIGYGLSYTNQLKTKYTDSGDNDNDDERKNGYEFGLNPSVTGNFRIGWTF